MRYIKASLLLISLLSTLAVTAGCLVDDDDHDWDHHRRHRIEERHEHRDFDHDRDWR